MGWIVVKLLRGISVTLAKFPAVKFLTANFPIANHAAVKFPGGKISMRKNFHAVKFPYGEISMQ